MSEATKFEGWAIVEFMGHVRAAGFLREQQVFGEPLIRIDVPPTTDGGDDGFTRYYHPKALYSLTPVGQDVAVHLARGSWRNEPVHAWDFPQPVMQSIANNAEPEDDGLINYGEDVEFDPDATPSA